MKSKIKILFYAVFFTFASCSEDAEDSANSEVGFEAGDINGICKVSSSNFTIRILGASESNDGNATITSVGSAMPRGYNKKNCVFVSLSLDCFLKQ